LAVSESIPVEARVMQVVTRHMESLKDHIDGGELHGIIARALRRYGRGGKMDAAALNDLHTQLDTYARDPVALPNMRVRARLLQQHIASFLPEPEPAPSAEAPLLAIESIEAAPAPEPLEALAALEPTDAAPAPEPLEGVLEPSAEQPRDTAAASAEKYQELLRSEKDAWQAIYGTVKDYHKLKQAWMKSLDELARQRDALEEKLVETTASLTTLEIQREEMQAEIARLRSAAKERPRAAVVRLALRPSHKPGTLVRREGLMHYLEAEIKRVRRAARPLALGLIAVEALDAMRDTHGEKAMEAALNCYTQEILANFRAYDIVALYGDGVFAVLFPDTGKEGASRALDKAAKRAAETHLTVDERIFPLPRFVHALVLHTAGEDSTSFLKRAETALQTARTNAPVSVVA